MPPSSVPDVVFAEVSTTDWKLRAFGSRVNSPCVRFCATSGVVTSICGGASVTCTD
jgi:hypothetical protein